MTVNILAAGGATVGNPAANIGIFALFVAITLYIVIRASKKNTTAAEFFTAGRLTAHRRRSTVRRNTRGLRRVGAGNSGYVTHISIKFAAERVHRRDQE